jgi:hypothetical protein
MGDMAGVVAGDVLWRWRWLGVVMVDAVYALGTLDPLKKAISKFQVKNFAYLRLLLNTVDSDRVDGVEELVVVMKSRSRLCDEKKTK